MHYEEKVIDGAMHFRVAPDGEWVQMPIEFLTGQYMALKASTEAYNPMTPLHSIQICGKELTWEMSLNCTGGSISLRCADWDITLASTGFGEFKDILNKASVWHDKILKLPGYFSMYLASADDAVRMSDRWQYYPNKLEEWLDA